MTIINIILIKERKHACMYCIQFFTTEEILNQHKEKIGTLRYPGRGLGRRQPEVNSQGLSFNLHKCHAT